MQTLKIREKLSRQKVKRALKEAGAGNIKIHHKNGILDVWFTCPEESDRHDKDWQRPTREFARKLFIALKKEKYPVEKLMYHGSGTPSFLTWWIGSDWVNG